MLTGMAISETRPAEALPPDAVVGVVGAGTMGAGIAQVALEAGHRVVLYDLAAGAAARARDRIERGLRRRASTAGLDAASADVRVAGQLERLRSAAGLPALADVADLVVEAALEDLSVKQSLFEALDRAARPEAILATNTSALAIGAIAAATSLPGRVLGLHFFNPPPVMALVEVVAAPTTDGTVARTAMATMAAWGKTPIRCADTPGFIVNRVNRPFTLEALRAVEAGAGPIRAIDDAVRGLGYRMGPFEYMDLVGVDVNLAAARSLYEALGRPARLRPSPIQEALVGAGRVGRKTGLGFYRYDGDGRPTDLGGLPDGLDRGTMTGPTSAPPATTRPTPGADEVARRISLAIANEAFFALDAGVAPGADIDLALRLGANHPWGPLEWARDHGPARVLAELERLAAAGEARFAPAPGLRSAATAGDR